jgi:hypothetical protein
LSAAPLGPRIGGTPISVGEAPPAVASVSRATQLLGFFGSASE